MHRRITTAIAAGALIFSAVVMYSHVERVDDGFIIATKTGVMDPIGELKLAFTRATRDCTAVKEVSSAEILAALAASKVVKINDANPKPRAGWKQDAWLLVEVDFDSLEPAILLIEHVASNYTVAALYGGTAAPFNDVQVIHSYFSRKQSAAPRQLINCYEPVGPPFDRAS